MPVFFADAKVRLVPWSGPAGGKVHQGFAESFHELLPLEGMGFAHVPQGRYLDRSAEVRAEPGSVALLLDGLAVPRLRCVTRRLP